MQVDDIRMERPGRRQYTSRGEGKGLVKQAYGSGNTIYYFFAEGLPPGRQDLMGGIFRDGRGFFSFYEQLVLRGMIQRQSFHEPLGDYSPPPLGICRIDE
jgi:hypothetical protein